MTVFKLLIALTGFLVLATTGAYVHAYYGDPYTNKGTFFYCLAFILFGLAIFFLIGFPLTQ